MFETRETGFCKKQLDRAKMKQENESLINPQHRANAFDLIRFLAATGVLFSHNFATVGLKEPVYFGGQTLGSLGVFVFFAVSGYLVQKSWDRRPDARSFILSRGLRIFPGLVVCLLFCAFILGPLVTKASLIDFFSSINTYRFIFANLMMFVQHYDDLPGVFLDVPLPPHVNSSLWTIRYEIFMYIVLLAVSSIFKRSVIPLGMLLLLFVGVWAFGTYTGMPDPGRLLWRLGSIGLDGKILVLAPFFLVGALLAKFAHRLFSAALAVSVVAAGFYDSSVAIFVLWFSLPYCLIV